LHVLIKTFSTKEQQIAKEIFDYTCSLEGVDYYMADGIMVRRETRRHKFLSISTKGNRLLFHLPIKLRDSVFDLFKEKMKIFIPVDPRDKNQIDIELKDIVTLESIKELINLA
jgi:hypothetical protein